MKKRLKKNKIVWCELSLFPFRYGFCPSEKAWSKLMKRLKVKDRDYPTSDAHVATFSDGRNSSYAIMTLDARFDTSKDAIGVCALFVHEATHIWQHALDMMSESDPSPEFEAYGISHIFQQLMLAYHKTRKWEPHA